MVTAGDMFMRAIAEAEAIKATWEEAGLTPQEALELLRHLQY